MTRVVVAVVMGFMLLGPPIPADTGQEEVKKREAVAAEPGRTERRPPGEAPLPAPADREEVKPSAAPAKPKSTPPFEPTEKVKADQAIDFPADI
ncbi:MAG: hypothetical protein MUF46_07640 [Desulfobacterales bacterium]|jgi:hypothetical protein|nr:hypothetical protein [Desulfobacterales bacterium]